MTELVTKIITLAADFAEASRVYKENPDLKKSSNCYTYALGIPEHGKATPGQLSAFHKVSLSDEQVNPEYVYNALIDDGLIAIEESELENMGERSIIAAFVVEGDDFHFMRKHKDGYWSHQLGYKKDISMLDGNNDLITDPQLAEMGEYKDFIGFFAVAEAGLTYTVQTVNNRKLGL
jgi:hypothetical protein